MTIYDNKILVISYLRKIIKVATSPTNNRTTTIVPMIAEVFAVCGYG